MTVVRQGSCLLVVDRDPRTAVTIDTLATRAGMEEYSVHTAPTIDGVSPVWERHEGAIVILAIDTAEMTAAEARARVEAVVSAGASAPIVLLSGSRDVAYGRAVLDAGAADYAWREDLSAALLESQIRHVHARAERAAEAQHRRAAESALRDSEAQMRIMLRQREELERDLSQVLRMESVGRLAGGIAHDFNNILMAVVGFGTILQEQVAGNEPLEQNCQEILAAAERASALTKQLLAFGRKQVLRPRRLQLNDTVVGITAMLRRVIGEDIDLQVQVDPEVPPVFADQAQIESSILNLVVNARDAMPNGGRVTITVSGATLTASDCDAHPGLKPGTYVHLSVADTGAGIPAELHARVFEPFFTTKTSGKGTGLGLSTVYGTIKQSGGYIWVESEPGHGTKFRIYMPVDTRPTDAAPAAPLLPTPIAAPAKATETILLVEDAEVVRRLTREIVSRAGYRVIEAGNAEEAMKVAEAHQGPLDLLLTDVIMPGANGVELAKRLRAVRVDLPVLYMSGYTDNAITRHGLLNERTAFLQKPFTPQDLLRKVREVLEVRA